MELLRITPEQRTRLIGLPETGMGYQILSSNGARWIVANASIAIRFTALESGFFTEANYDALSGDPDEGRAAQLPPANIPGDFKILSGVEDDPIPFSPLYRNLANPVPPSDQAIPADSTFSYYRFSAYSKDWRVTAYGFVPGTYATTYSDLHFVPSGFAAVGRYALPNPASARFVFQIVTVTRPTLMGTAVPNYGQAGGGVEVFFQNGAINAPGFSFPINVG